MDGKLAIREDQREGWKIKKVMWGLGDQEVFEIRFGNAWMVAFTKDREG